jgi:hypothetical protein
MIKGRDSALEELVNQVKEAVLSNGAASDFGSLTTGIPTPANPSSLLIMDIIGADLCHCRLPPGASLVQTHQASQRLELIVSLECEFGRGTGIVIDLRL